MALREAHQLKPTNKAKLPRRFIFFDTEAKTDIHIREADVDRLLGRGTDITTEPEPVFKPHDIYYISATFKHLTNAGNAQRNVKRYKSKDFPVCADRDLCRDFWGDVDRFARMNENLYLFAHNAKYDVLVSQCVPTLVRLGYKLESFSDDHPFMMTFEKEFIYNLETKEKYQRTRGDELVEESKKKTITIISSTNFYAQSLKSLGDVFGLPKLDFDHDVVPEIEAKFLDPEFTEEQRRQTLEWFWTETVTYGDRDVEILEAAIDALVRFVIREKLGSFKLTIASQAFAAFRARFLEGHDLFIHDDAEALKTERRAYAGGRTEVLHRLGKIPHKIFYVDVNSMYAHVMRDNLFPTKLIKRWYDCSVDRLKDLIQDGYLVCCDVYIQTEKRIFHKKDKRLIFPVGGYWTTLCTPELIKAFDENAIQEVKNVCIYEAGNYFEEYVDYFYTKRLASKAAGDAVHDLLYKNFLTNLYGKFGQRKETWEFECYDDGTPIEIDPEIADSEIFYGKDGTIDYIRRFGGRVWRKPDKEEREESYHSFPCVAAHVTAYARMLLYEAIETAGIEDVYYCDTDSIMCTEEAYQKLVDAGLIDNKKLGKLKLEKVGTLHLYGVKDYRFILPVDRQKVRRSKAARRRFWRLGRMKLTRRFLYNMETKIKGVSKYAKPLGVNADGKQQFAVTQWGGISAGLTRKSFSVYYNQVMIKTLRRDYNKGEVDGVNIKPFRLNDREAERREGEASMRIQMNDLLDADVIRSRCAEYGFIRTIKKGERYYEEYRRLPAAWKMRYFRKSGIPVDVWAADNHFTVDGLFLEISEKKRQRVS